MEPNKEKIYLFTGRDPGNINLPGRIVHYPLIKTAPIDFEIENVGQYEGIIFTSRMSVSVFCGRYRIGDGQKILAVGPNTKKELEELGYRVDYMPDIPNSEELARLIIGLSIGQLLYPTSDISDNELSHLRNVKTFAVYATTPLSQPRVSLGDYAGVIFSSPSTVDSFLNIYGLIPSNLKIYVYGKKTAERLRKKGYKGDIEVIKV